jgi:virulence factor Mce-like protein
VRRIATALILLVAGLAAVAASAGADDTHEYRIEMYNAFGIVNGSDVRVNGVNVGQVTDIGVNSKKRAVVDVELQGELAVLGQTTTCSSEPQSLIAEYFIDCEPSGPPIASGGTIPASQVRQTVQPDLVQNTVREPYMERFRMLLSEFGTGLAGNAETLNEAIRLGAPALTELQRATSILAEQRQMIRRLNVDSNTIMTELAAQRDEVVRFVEEAGRTAEISSSRRDDLSRQWEIFDDFLAELDPTLADLEGLAREQTPLLRDLRVAAPHLNRLALALPPFNRASERSLSTLGKAAVVGRRAVEKGERPIELLARAGRAAPRTTEILADLLRDLDDPRRIVEIDRRAAETTGRKGTRPGRRDTMGYTGLEGLLNYPYYQALALNQFDQVGHLLHFGLYGINTGPCGSFSSGRDIDTGEPGVPKAGGGTTTNILDAAGCVGWLGPNQPGISEPMKLPKYHPSVCRDGASPERVIEELCTPPAGGSATASRDRRTRLDEIIDARLNPPSGPDAEGPGAGGPERGGPGLPGGLPNLPLPGGGKRGGAGLPGVGDVRDLPDRIGLPRRKGRSGPGRGGRSGGSVGDAATKGLFDFLLRP